jgi:transcriptional regulator with XRE-family HTH domain
MDLKRIFILNLKKFRKIEGISQMKLAERCETDVSYIGQIETGRRFPSIMLIEKMAQALKIEPHRLFMTEQGLEYGRPSADFLASVPRETREKLISHLNTSISACVNAALNRP